MQGLSTHFAGISEDLAPGISSVNEEKFLERKTGTFSEFRLPLKQDYLTHTICFSIHDQRGFC